LELPAEPSSLPAVLALPELAPVVPALFVSPPVPRSPLPLPPELLHAASTTPQSANAK
jgi:hypothetical protein